MLKGICHTGLWGRKKPSDSSPGPSPPQKSGESRTPNRAPVPKTPKPPFGLSLARYKTRIDSSLCKVQVPLTFSAPRVRQARCDRADVPCGSSPSSGATAGGCVWSPVVQCHPSAPPVCPYQPCACKWAAMCPLAVLSRHFRCMCCCVPGAISPYGNTAYNPQRNLRTL